MIETPQVFKIEIKTSESDWTDDPTYLGHGCNDSDNRWDSESGALNACDELAVVFGCPRSDLRVVPA